MEWAEWANKEGITLYLSAEERKQLVEVLRTGTPNPKLAIEIEVD